MKKNKDIVRIVFIGFLCLVLCLTPAHIAYEYFTAEKTETNEVRIASFWINSTINESYEDFKYYCIWGKASDIPLYATEGNYSAIGRNVTHYYKFVGDTKDEKQTKKKTDL